MELETLLRESDPARHVDVPDASSVVAEHIRQEVMSRADAAAPFRIRPWKRRWMGLPVAGVVAAGVAAILIITLVPGAIGRSPTAAAMALTRLASRAAQGPTTLGPGEYYYTDVESPIKVAVTRAPSGAPYSWYFSGTVQTWVAADGSGRQVTTTDPNPRFFTGADRALWVSAGEPSLKTPGSLSSTQDFTAGSASEVNGPIPLYDVTSLPTDPGALATVLATGTLPSGIAALDSGNLFWRTVALLQGPDIGGTPALRGALFQILATVPGIQLLGTTTDRAGQSGLGLQLVDQVPASTETVTCEPGNGPTTSLTESRPASTTTFTIVVDPQTTTLLSSEETISPSVATVFGNPCGPSAQSPQTTRLTPSWTTILAEGIVDSATATAAPSAGAS
jgi:hypothetical protein